MKRMTFKILFVVKASRVARDGKSPVYLRVTVNGLRCETSISLRVDFKKWNTVAEKVIGDSREDQELNFRLDTIRMRIMQIYREMEFDRLEITAKKIIDQYLGRNDKPTIMLLDVFREHNERCHKLIGKGMAAATVTRYETSLKHTANFIQFCYGKEDIPISDVNHKFITDYEFYLKTERNCSHNSATKYLKNFKKIIRIALANDYITKDPFSNIKFTLDEVERDFLEDSEIQRIMDKKIDITRLAVVRDIFVFQCFTGLSYSDVKSLRREHIATDNNGKQWIRKKRQKTNNMCNIPLLDVALQIMERYKNHPECIRKDTILPVPCNQKLNAYLKELADICGITKQISSHSGRHSYATSVCLANGVSIENVAKMLGHSDTKMTRHYAKVLDKSIMQDMEVVNGKFSIG